VPITLHDERGLAAAAPAYVKSHSLGEFVFDQSWAHAYAQHGLAYYPKLVLGIPFTPATGTRLLVRPDLDAQATRTALIGAIRGFAESHDFSSIHALFVAEDDRAALAHEGWLSRQDVQFHWHNRDYRDFDHYLEGFTAEKRKKAKRERRRVAEEGIEFETLLGGSIDRKAVDEVYDLHRDTFLRHGHEPYLTRAFFRAMPKALGDAFMIKRARLAGRTVAAAVFFWSAEALYGRYWARARITTACISRPATTRAWISASSAASRVSSPARRASTRSAADSCRRAPGPCTGSSIRAFVPPSVTTCGASRCTSTNTPAKWTARALSRRAPRARSK
jgi:predicted N-acyltransferase